MKETDGLNRAQRRALKSGKGPKRPARGTRKPIDFSPVMRCIADRRQLRLDDFIADFIQTEERFGRLSQGAGTVEDFDEVALRLGMALNRAKDIGDALLSEVQLACNAMDTLRNRYLDRGRFVMTGPEKVAIRLGLDYLEDMVRNSSRAQMQAAWDRSLRNIDAMMDKRVKLGLPALPTKEHP